MPYVTTLIAPQQAPFFDDAPLRVLASAGIAIENRVVIEDGRAVDLFTARPVPRAVLDDVRMQCGIDLVCQDAATRAKRLFVADMDATMVMEETLDELAHHAGIKDKVAAITARAMNGELDFRAALNERVGLLKGLPVAALQETAAKMTFTPGGARLLQALRDHGIETVLVSGGFTFFTGHVAQHLGFGRHYGNTLHVDGAVLAGTVGEPLVDKLFKETVLRETADTLGIDVAQTVAIGDGANDLPMLQAAGLGVGWRSKKLLRDSLPNHILLCDMDALIYVLGLPGR